jgi:hypothetical protein
MVGRWTLGNPVDATFEDATFEPVKSNGVHGLAYNTALVHSGLLFVELGLGNYTFRPVFYLAKSMEPRVYRVTNEPLVFDYYHSPISK